MLVAIAGAHGKIAMRLTARLAARGDGVIGLIRNPDHAADVQSAGAEPVVCDLERASVDEVAAAVQRADAVVFAAGAGPGSGAGRKLSMDRDGAIKLLKATAERATPFVIVSSVGAENPAPEDGDDVAEVLAAVLHDPRANHYILYVNGGEEPVEDGLGRILADTG